ncbi:MAG: carboxypeptidase-like regulatory domain-containing protein, partial [Cetobacterium sp.]
KGAISSGVKVDIPLVPVSMISGYIESDTSIDEKRYGGLIANLDVVLKKGDEEIKKSVTEIDGYYFFEDILPGEYTVEIIPNSRRYKGEFDKKELKVAVKTGREGDYYEDNNFLVKSIELIEDEILDSEENIEEGLKDEEVI